jgi:microcystin degradation protein MlrC
VIRLGVLGLSLEANSFSPELAGPADIAARRVEGAALAERYRGSRSVMAGYLSVEDDPEVDVIPLLYAGLTPTGPFRRDAFEPFVEELCAQLSEHGPWDGVLLSVHGAAVAEHLQDADGEIMRRVREAIGTTLLGVTLDMHANVSPLMAAQADVISAFQTNPHVDAFERSRLVAELIVSAARGTVRPRTMLTQVPAAIDILRQHTGSEPMASLTALAADRVAQDQRLLDASILEGFPYSDVEKMGMSVLVVADDDPDLAQQVSDEIAAAVWERRREFIGQAPTPAEAISDAMTATSTPVLLLDVGDNIGGGGTGDSVVLITEAHRQGARGVLSIVQDPDSAAACHAAGVGAQVDLELGGHRLAGTGPPFTVTATVKALHDGPFEDHGPTHGGGSSFDTGKTALIEYDQDCRAVITSVLELPSGLAQPRVLGAEPTEARIIIGKGVQSPLAGYGPIAASVQRVDTPGVTAANLLRLHHQNRRRPLFPYENTEETP